MDNASQTVTLRYRLSPCYAREQAAIGLMLEARQVRVFHLEDWPAELREALQMCAYVAANTEPERWPELEHLSEPPAILAAWAEL